MAISETKTDFGQRLVPAKNKKLKLRGTRHDFRKLQTTFLKTDFIKIT